VYIIPYVLESKNLVVHSFLVWCHEQDVLGKMLIGDTCMVYPKQEALRYAVQERFLQTVLDQISASPNERPWAVKRQSLVVVMLR
jgi:hypothetical protein